MHSAVLDAPRLPAVAAPAPRPARARRVPLPVAAVGVLSVAESLGLLAFGLTGLGSLFAGGTRLSGAAVAGALLLLAGWVVLTAGAGAALVDGVGRRLLVGVAVTEIGACLAVAVHGLLGPDGVRLLAVTGDVALPVPALGLLALAVPTGKLLLAGAPTAQAWVAAGGRPRRARRAPAPPEHRGLLVVTLACIGLALAGVAVLGAPADAPVPTTAAVTGGR